MKFALYQPWIYLHGGLERSLLELVKRSRHEWVIFTGYYDPAGTFPEFQRLDVRVVGKTSVKRTFGGVLASSLDTLLVKLPLDSSFDGLVVWCDGIGDLISFRNGGLPIYNICSTPLRAVFDPVYEKMLKVGMGRRKRIAYRCFKSVFKAVDRLAWKRYRGIVTTSKEVESRILAGGLAPSRERMVMAYPGVDWQPELPERAFEKIMVMPGRMMWTKNIEQAIRAFLLDPPPGWKLVIAGYVDEKSKSYFSELVRLTRGSSQVEFLVSPTDAQLQELYRTASVCLFTPLNEDWGIVPLEAMAHGKGVIANARGGPLESVVHEQTGLLLEPDDAAWSAAIKRIAGDPDLARRYGDQAHRHVQRFTWQRFTDTVDEALESWTRSPATAGVPMPAGAALAAVGGGIAPMSGDRN